MRAFFWVFATLMACGDVATSTDPDAVPENCSNAADDDGDGNVDCADDECACPEICANDVDDDRDGLADCDDDDCDGDCPEVCTDGRDNDGDGTVDCLDRDCVTPECAEDCGDDRDNDGDGAIDCSDTDCNLDTCDELCADGRDNDGDGAMDCDDADCDGDCPENCADGRDNDGDGAMDCDDTNCEVECPEDCLNFADDDADGDIDCDDAECSVACDTDLDGFLNQTHGGDDCDDNDPFVNPLAQEVCNGVDDDCNGLTDLADLSLDPTTLTAYHPDDDADGFGARNTPITWECLQPEGMSVGDLDCDDANAAINPSANEICDGLDNDCDNLRDDGDPSVDLTTATDWYTDADGDGFGDPDVSIFACNPPANTVDNDDDCDDLDPLILSEADWLPDEDMDGYGFGIAYGAASCTPPLVGSWASEAAGVDCDDSQFGVNPGAVEVCSGIDEDCDLMIDEEDDSLDESTLITWYPDVDEDGFGSKADSPIETCFSAAPYDVVDRTDCDDTNPDIHPLAQEICDGVDNDCDTRKDDADPSVDLSTATDWFLDLDGDGFGIPGGAIFACAPPAGRVDNDDDCDDTDPLIFAPGDWVEDTDSDGYGEGPLYGVVSCDPPEPGWVSEYLDEDCAPTDLTIHPGAEEVCEDGIDQDCNGLDKNCAPLSSPAYSADKVFDDETGSTAMTTAWDGMSYYTCSGGSSAGDRLAEYDATGSLVGKFAPSIDFRSVFTLGDGVSPIYARGYASADILERVAPAMFVKHLTLAGGIADAQSAVAWDDTRSEYIAFTSGTLTRWDATGAKVGTLVFAGYGAGGENVYPQNRGVATAGGYYFTYHNGTLSAWDETGARVATTTLTGAGKTFDSHFSLSYADSRIWIVDGAYGTWRGYPIDL